MLDFLRCGNMFYPIPMIPLPIPKSFQMWGLPPLPPMGFVMKFGFFYGDRGGCFFLNGDASSMAGGGLAPLMVR